jgi:DDE superfamily endonuclease/Helix-turn-helix of DDE superfamily endonuclease
MILRYARLSQYPTIFKSMTGLRVPEFATLVADLLPAYYEAERSRLSRPTRQRAIGAGTPFTLPPRDQLLLVVVWLRQYPTHEVLGYLFGVSDSTVSRTVARLLPLLEQAGQASMHRPDRGRRSRRTLDDLLADTPELAVLIDTFEQPVQRPRDRTEADRHYSGKQKRHTLKSQVAVYEASGQVVDVADSVPGPTADITVLKDSRVLERLPAEAGAMGDLAYVGMNQLTHRPTATPRRKPRGKDRPAEDVAYNRACARRRVVAEHTIGRMRRYQALSQVDRHHRRAHTGRVRAVAGLVNRQLHHRHPY